jgi:hypothetical protein
MHRKASQARCRPSFIGVARANVAGTRREQGPRAHAACKGWGLRRKMIARSGQRHIPNSHCERSEAIKRSGLVIEGFVASLLAMAGTTIGGGTHDRVPDSARIGWPGRDRSVGGIFVNSESLQFIALPDEIESVFAGT